MPEIKIHTAGILLKVQIPQDFQIDEQATITALIEELPDHFRDCGQIEPGLYGVALECDPLFSSDMEDKVLLLFTRHLRKIV